MAFTQQSGKFAFYEDQNLSRAAPTTSTADGVPVPETLDALTVVVEANASQTLSGGGTLQAYLYDEFVVSWIRCPELDVTTIPSGVPRAAFNFVISGTRSGLRVMWAAASVTVSSGTTVRLFILGGQDEIDD